MKDLLIIIPARSGSTRIKNKNMKLLNGKPLLFYKIKSCLKIKFATVFVSTNDKKIASFSKNNGAFVPFLRPQIYASSKASTSSVVLDTLRKFIKQKIKLPSYIAVLPPTNPFLKFSIINKAYYYLKKNKKFNSIISYTDAQEHPFNFIALKKNKIKFNIIKYKGKTYSQLERTQDWPKAIIGSSALKITKTKFFLDKIENKSPNYQLKCFDINSSIGIKITNLESFDINHPSDFDLAQYFKKKMKLNV